MIKYFIVSDWACVNISFHVKFCVERKKARVFSADKTFTYLYC